MWEAAQVAAYHKLDNLCGITDVNGFGQSRATQWDRDLEEYASRWRAFGWHAISIDGHDMKQVLAALAEARADHGQADDDRGEDAEGKGLFDFRRQGQLARQGPEEGRRSRCGDCGARSASESRRRIPRRSSGSPRDAAIEGALPDFSAKLPTPAYKIGDSVATREAYGTALAALGAIDRRVVALDADVKNSTFSERFEKVCPERFYQTFIAEQAMVGAAMGLAARGAIPFPSTFAAFLERACDFIRMAGISNVNVKLAGSHAGVSIGEDGPSQMALEDLAMFRGVPNCTVFYPSDAMSAERIMALAAATPGLVYVRTSRPKTPVIYGPDETFAVGGSKTVRKSANDVATVVAAGVTLTEAVKAADELAAKGVGIRVIDLYSVQPIDRDGLIAAGKATGGRIITVEDHYANGGIGDAVSEAVWDQGFRVQRLAVREIPRSGPPDVLLDKYGISAKAIVAAVLQVKGQRSKVKGKLQGRRFKVRAGRYLLPSAVLVLTMLVPVSGAPPQDPQSADNTTITTGVREAAWSPDGKRLAVTWFDAIWTMTPDGKEPKRARHRAAGMGRRTGSCLVARRQVHRLQRQPRWLLRLVDGAGRRRRAAQADDIDR